jgi:hypothetical protein
MEESIIHSELFFSFYLDQSLLNVDVELYSILLGHEEAIYGLCWYPNTGRFIEIKIK